MTSYMLNNICVLEPALTRLEAEQNILHELHRMKRFREASFIAINRAIRIQKRRIKKL